MDSKDVAQVANQFAELAAEIHGEGTAVGRWRRIGELAVRHVQGCTWSSISDLHAGRGRSLGASDPIAAYLDQLQFDVGEGPCLQSAAEHASVVCPDLDQDDRWPAFVQRAREETPLRSVVAIRLPGRDAAAMNFYADQVDAFDERALATASILAANAAGLLVVGEATERSRNLEQALGSNRQIGMAIGVLMAHHKVTEEDAFDLLRTASQGLHRKLRDIAVEVTETGALPDLPARNGSRRDAAAQDRTQPVGGNQ